MNATLLEVSVWLWDYYLAATVLLSTVLAIGFLVKQPVRRMAIHWATACCLIVLAGLLAIPGWSVLSLFDAPPEPPPVWREAQFEPVLGPAIQVAELPPRPAIVTPAQPAEAAAPNELSAVRHQVVAIDYGVLSLYALALGSCFAFAWLSLGYLQVQHLRRLATAPPEQLQGLLSRLIGLTIKARLGISHKLPVAVAVGLRDPMVLLPEQLLAASNAKELETVLAHELAHIRHRDLWLLAMLRCLLLVLWPHPLYWLWRRGVRLDQETLADAAAAEVTDRGRYAEQLVAWARVATTSRAPRLASSVGLWESPSQLRRRVAVLLDEKLTILRACSRGWRVGSAALLLLVAVGLSLVTLQPANEVAAEPTEQDESVTVTEATPHQTTPSKPDERLITLLEKSVENYAKTLNIVEAWNADGVAGGSGADVLLAKLQWLQARIALAEAKQQTDQVSELHQAAVKTAKQRVELVQLRYDAGNESLESVLSAQRLQTESEIAQLAAEQAVTKARESADLLFESKPDEQQAPAVSADVLETQTYSPAQWPRAITGIVVDDEDQPVAGAALTLTLQRIYEFGIGRYDESLATVEALSDRNGRYEFDLKEFPVLRHRPFSLNLSAVAEGHSDVRTWNWYSDEREANVSGAVFDVVRMPRGRIVTGRCVDPQGQPVGGAVIRTVVDYGTKWMHEPIQTDAQGNFELPVAKEGAAHLWIYSSSWAAKDVSVPKETTDLGTITLEKGTVVEGTVLDLDGKPCSGCVVAVEGEFFLGFGSYGGRVETGTKTDADGHYRLPPLKGEYKVYLAQAEQRNDLPGEQFVFSTSPPPPSIPQRVNLDGTQSEVQVDFRGQETITLSGTVRWADGSPVEGCEMKYASRGGEWLGRSLTNGQGVYTLTIPKDMPEVLLFAFGARDRNGEWQTPYTAETMPVEKPGAIQSVRVEESLDQDRTGYDWVLRAQGPENADKQSDDAQTLKVSGNLEATESKGTLTITGGALSILESAEVDKPKVSNKFTLVCRDADEQPLSGLEATLYRLSRVTGEQTQLKSARTDDEGSVEFDTILPPDVLAEQQRRIAEWDHPTAPETYYAVVFSGEGLATEVSLLSEFQLALNHERRVLTMRPAATLRGRVVDPAGKPVAGASVAVGSLANLFALTGVNATITDDAGRFEFTKLRPFDVADAAKHGLNEWVSFIAVGDKTPPQPPRRDIEPLTSALVVRHPDFATISMIGGNIPGDVEIEMQPAGSIVGRVVFHNGRPAANIPIQIVDRKQQLSNQDSPEAMLETLLMPYSALTHTDSEGNYRFDNLSATRYDVTPQADSMDISRAAWIGLGKAGNPVMTGETTTVDDITIGPGGSLRGKLIDADTGKPPVVPDDKSAITIIYFSAAQRQFSPDQTFSAGNIQLQPDGSFKARAPAGEFRVLVFGAHDETLQPPSNIFRTADNADHTAPALHFENGESTAAEITVYSAQHLSEYREFMQEAYHSRGQGEVAQTIAKLEAGLEKYPEYTFEISGVLSDFYERGGQWSKAINSYESQLPRNLEEANMYDTILLIHLADLLATVPDAELRDGPRAIELATRVVGSARLTESTNSDFLASALNILAAAQAESGDFDAAIKSQQETLQLAPNQAFEFENRLKLYQQGKPFHREEVSAD